MMHLLNNSSEQSLAVGLQYPLFAYLKTGISELHVHHIRLLASNAGDLGSLHAPPEVYALFFVGNVCCFSFSKFAEVQELRIFLLCSKYQSVDVMEQKN